MRDVFYCKIQHSSNSKTFSNPLVTTTNKSSGATAEHIQMSLLLCKYFPRLDKYLQYMQKAKREPRRREDKIKKFYGGLKPIDQGEETVGANHMFSPTFLLSCKIRCFFGLATVRLSPSAHQRH